MAVNFPAWGLKVGHACMHGTFRPPSHTDLGEKRAQGEATRSLIPRRPSCGGGHEGLRGLSTCRL